MADYDEIPYFFAREQNFCPQDDIKYEFIGVTDEVVCLFFANHSNDTKVLVKFDAGY